MTNLLTADAVSGSGHNRFKRLALGTVGVAALCLASQLAYAQDLAQNAPTVFEEVTITGTRVQRDGYSAPTPVTVLSAQEIAAGGTGNVADFVNTLPSVMGSLTTNGTAASISGGGAGISALNLRQLGVSRTLVLLDGHRSSPSQATGEVDINTFPQHLVQRIDVVTGGASADYGSDAIGGVVNFILDKHYSGFKTKFEYGETTYGDQPNYTAALTWGSDILGGKGHVILSGEAYTSEGIIGEGSRNLGSEHYFTVQNANGGTGGQPYYIVSKGVVPSQVTPGGIVVSGPLQGTYFGVNAAVGQLAYGQVHGSYMIGGDQTTTCNNYCDGTGTDLAAAEMRTSLYGRASYQLLPGLELYSEASIARAATDATYLHGWANVGGVTIRSDNAFLPASVAAQMAANKLTSITIGTSNQGLLGNGYRNTRQVSRFLVGAGGEFDFLGHWNYDVFGQVSQTNLHIRVTGDWQTQNMALAQDAVYVTGANVGASGLAIGSIACRSTLTSPTNGCKPLSRIGINGGLQSAAAYQAGINYVYPQPQPSKIELLRNTDFGVNITGSPFDTWAGPVSVAFGGEWRLESVNGKIDPYFSVNWLDGNYLTNVGHYSVAEGYVEAVVPVLKNADVSGSFRYAAYSTSGGVNTWKLGANYQPFDDLKLRVTYSHDIRAPNLSELFAAGTARTQTVTIKGASYSALLNQTGNPNLSPEAANSLGAGIVLTPSFIPNLTASIDYFNITVAHQIGVISAQNVANLCYDSNQQSFCNNIIGTGSLATGNLVLSRINLSPINYNTVKAEGIDFDMTYVVPLDAITMFGVIPGDLSLHGLATHYMRNYTSDGFSPTTDRAGVNASGGLPSWSYRFMATYHTDPWTFNLVGRGISAGKLSNEFLVCQTTCPISNPQTRTINYNEAPAAFYMDLTVSYAFIGPYDTDASAFFTIRNAFNSLGAQIPNGPGTAQTPAYPQTNTSLYDVIGRVYRVGIRASL